MFTLVSQNVLAVNFTTANTTFSLYSSYLQGQDAAGFLAVNKSQGGTSSTGSTGVAELGIASAKLDGLCAIAKQSLPVIGDVYLMIIAGDQLPATPFDGSTLPAGVSVDSNGLLSGSSLADAIQATTLYVNSNNLAGLGNQISGLNLGQDAGTVGASAGLTWPTDQNAGSTPTAGQFGLYAHQLNVAGLNGQTYGVNLKGSITLPDLKIKVIPSSTALGQSACNSEY